jgi:hypothetical protein
MPRIILNPTPRRRAKIDAVTRIVKRVCLLSQSDSFLIAKAACVFNPPRRYAGGKFAAKDE